MPISTYFRNAICNVLRGTNATGFTPFVALFNGDPGAGGTEVTTSVRTLGRLSATFAAPVNGVMTNSAAVNFGASAGTATITHFALYDTASGGNLIGFGPLQNGTQQVAQSQPVSFAIGSLSFTVV